MQILNPKKQGVPRVPCVPKLLRAFEFKAFNGGTQIVLNWKTWTMGHQRCSRICNASKQHLPPISDGLLASLGVGARVYWAPGMGRGARNE